jgi:hypothetical protein
MCSGSASPTSSIRRNHETLRVSAKLPKGIIPDNTRDVSAYAAGRQPQTNGREQGWVAALKGKHMTPSGASPIFLTDSFDDKKDLG